MYDAPDRGYPVAPFLPNTGDNARMSSRALESPLSGGEQGLKPFVVHFIPKIEGNTCFVE